MHASFLVSPPSMQIPNVPMPSLFVSPPSMQIPHASVVKATRQRPPRKGDLSDVLKIETNTPGCYASFKVSVAHLSLFIASYAMCSCMLACWLRHAANAVLRSSTAVHYAAFALM